MSGKYVPRSLRGNAKRPRGAGTATAERATEAPERPSPRPRPAGEKKTDTAPKPRVRDGGKPRPRPRPGPGRQRAKARSRGRYTVRALRRLGLRLTATAVLVLLVAGAVQFFGMRERAIDSAVAEARTQATLAVQAVFGWDYRAWESSVANGRTYLAGERLTEYEEQMAALRPMAEESKAMVSVTVSEVGLVSTDTPAFWSFEPESVQFLVFSNMTRRNDKITGEKVDQNRVVITMKPVDGTWKATAFEAV